MNSIEDIIKIIEKISNKKIISLNKPVSGTMEFVSDMTLLKTLTDWNPKYSAKEGFETMYNVMKKNINKNYE